MKVEVPEEYLLAVGSLPEQEGVTPRSGGYGDATATYIRKSEVPSRMYAKHQYKKKSEYGST